jgi:hypothetical protein
MENLQEPLKNYEGSINVVKNDLDNDYSVHIQGPEEAVPGTEIEYKVIVKGTDNDIPTPKLEIDGENKNLVKLSQNEWSFEQEFASPETKEFKASISVQDAYKANNEFYQAVEIIEKPEILVLGQQESFSQEIKKVYDVEKSQSLPEDLSKYDSVIAKSQEYLKPSLEKYVADGNGLLYTGKPEESIITPMRPGSQIERENDVERTSDSIILMDASISRQDGPLRRSKALAYRLLDSMPDSNNAGVAAYNRKGYKLEQLTNLGINRDSLKETISRIEPGGPTFHHQGLKTADNMVGDNGNIIMITDGLLSRINRVKGVPEKTINASKQLESELIILDTNPGVNPEFLKNLTREAGGEYVTADNQGTLSFVFQAQQTKDRYKSLYKLDSSHFITRNNILKASIRPRQETKVKQGAQTLIQAEDIPYLATWRYGLGRVAQTNDQDSNLD